MKRTLKGILMVAAMAAIMAGCGKNPASADGETTELSGTTTDAEKEESKEETGQAEGTSKEEAADEVTITIAAAASLETCIVKELIPLFEKNNPGIKVIGTYDSSGKLQTQIEEGAEVDVFFSAAIKQMDALKEQGLMENNSIVDLLENKIVFIVPTGDEGNYSSFEDIKNAESIALGDPGSVPVGQYSEQALKNLGIMGEVEPKLSLGTNVTEVLNWVAEGSAKAGIVYATDAAQTDKVTVVAEAPEGSVNKVIYPVGVVKAAKNQDAAQKFVDFLQSPDALSILKKNGFTPVAVK